MLKGTLEYADVGENAKLRITGGGASSPLWAQIKADTVGLDLGTVCESETACLGSAILAMVGAGVYSDIPSACKNTVKVDKTYSPSGVDYSQAYEKFCELDKKLG